LLKAETYLDKAKTYFHESQLDCWETQHLMMGYWAHKAMIARLRGELDQARDLLQTCISRAYSLSFVAGLYCELALVEHLAGNKELAYSYEERGLNLFRQVGLLDKLPSDSCFKVIEKMKQDGLW
jgi:hypothetical protein